MASTKSVKKVEEVKEEKNEKKVAGQLGETQFRVRLLKVVSLEKKYKAPLLKIISDTAEKRQEDIIGFLKLLTEVTTEYESEEEIYDFLERLLDDYGVEEIIEAEQEAIEKFIKKRGH